MNLIKHFQRNSIKYLIPLLMSIIQISCSTQSEDSGSKITYSITGKCSLIFEDTLDKKKISGIQVFKDEFIFGFFHDRNSVYKYDMVSKELSISEWGGTFIRDIEYYNKSIGAIVGGFNSNEILVTHNGGREWASFPYGSKARYNNSVSFIDSNTILVVGAGSGNTLLMQSYNLTTFQLNYIDTINNSFDDRASFGVDVVRINNELFQISNESVDTSYYSKHIHKIRKYSYNAKSWNEVISIDSIPESCYGIPYPIGDSTIIIPCSNYGYVYNIFSNSISIFDTSIPNSFVGREMGDDNYYIIVNEHIGWGPIVARTNISSIKPILNGIEKNIAFDSTDGRLSIPIDTSCGKYYLAGYSDSLIYVTSGCNRTYVCNYNLMSSK